MAARRAVSALPRPLRPRRSEVLHHELVGVRPGIEPFEVQDQRAAVAIGHGAPREERAGERARVEHRSDNGSTDVG